MTGMKVNFRHTKHKGVTDTDMRMKKIRFSIGTPPLVLIGTFIVLFPIFTYMTIDRINRQRTQSIKLLVEKSTALIRTFEAGTHTGMMHMDWNRTAMENLLKETGTLPDISYLFIVNRKGTVLVSSDEKWRGKTYGRSLDLDAILDSGRLQWRIKNNDSGKNVFEVYKKFSPVRQNDRLDQSFMMPMHRRMQGSWMGDDQAGSYRDTAIFVGLDMSSIEQAYENDIRHNIIMGVILTLIGVSGFVLVFTVQRYAAARSSLSRIKIFSDNLVENMPLGMIATNTEGRIVSVNPAARSIFDIPPETGLQDIYKYLPGELKTLFNTGETGKQQNEEELRIDGVKERTLVLETITSPLYDREGMHLGSLLLIRDKTELDRLKTEMEANKRFASIGRLAAGIAHEIRNPLSSIKGYAVFFKEVFDKSSENYEIADMMTREADRLNRVVSEMGELAKPVSVSKEPVDIRAVIEDSIRLISREADMRNVKVETGIDPEVPMIYADQDKLRQVLLNLCLNGVQAMEGAGTLRLELFRDKKGKNVIIAVEDTGEGINAENLADIFEPYYTSKQSGTGLGLAVVHNVVKAHKGEIKVESEPGRGTRFTIILPRNNGEENE